MQNLYLYFLLEEMMDTVMDLLGSAPKPFLGYFHLFPPHEPYHPRREFAGMFEDGWAPVTKEPHPQFSAGHSQAELNVLRTWYDEYLAHTDAEFGRLYRFLEDSGALENTYVVLTSDHGQLFERGIHGHITQLLYEPLLHIPLLISRPGQQEREDVYAPTICVDLLPSLLHAVGGPMPPWCDGQLLPGLGGTADAERAIYALEAKQNAAYGPLQIGTMALIRGRHKLIHYFGYPAVQDQYELYDLEEDPEELDDLYPLQMPLAADLQEEMQAKLAEVNSIDPGSEAAIDFPFEAMTSSGSNE
jgi:arylsulfatase A-like enzyme